jgi:hypothetical protein
MEFPSGSKFELGPKESVTVVPRLIPGRDFTAGEVVAAGAQTILVTGYANGILLGGMAYSLDPTLKKPGSAQPGTCVSQEQECVAKELLKLFSLGDEKIKSVRLRKVIVEIDFKDDCC